MSEELVKHCLPTIGRVADVKVLFRTCMLAVAQASIVVHQLGGEDAIGKSSGDAACCMIAAGCSEQQGYGGVRLLLVLPVKNLSPSFAN